MNCNKDFRKNILPWWPSWIKDSIYSIHSSSSDKKFVVIWRLLMWVPLHFFWVKKTIINQIINQVLIDYESLGCLLLFHLIMSFKCLSDNFYTCTAMILDKMCWEFCTYLHTGHLYHYKPSTHPTLKSMWFTQEQKQTWTLYFFWGGGRRMI